MKLQVLNILRFIFTPVSKAMYKKRLPYFEHDFGGERVYMISELPGGELRWIGERRRNAYLGNTHPWNRYFNKPLKTKSRSLADIETFLCSCKYMSDQKTRSQSDFWEPPDEFERRKTGDCEDHAIWAWRQLHDMGYKTRFVVDDHRVGHAWVHIFINGRVYLLEATQKLRGAPNINSYDPCWSVERIGKKKFAFFLHSDDA